MGNLPQGEWPSRTLNIPGQGQISSDSNLLLTDDFPPGGALEFDLGGRSHLRFVFLPNEPAHSIEVHIGFREKSEIEVSALFEDTPVAQTVVSGGAGDTATATLEFDAITEVKLDSGPAALVDLCYFPVSQNVAAGWEPILEFPYPMCLPVTHPDYPCTPGTSEDLAGARDLARGRIRYGDPDQFTSPPVPIHTAGTISVVNGTPIVTGMGTNWTDELVGSVLQVAGDPTAYTIGMVVGPDKLVLSRAYTGSASTGATYAINQDDFGQLHDYLVHLVRGGTASGSMANRSLPIPIHSAGTIFVENNSPTVTGTGTNWEADLTGLVLQIGADATGTISVTNGSPVVTGAGTNWGAHLAGMTLKVAGEQTAYIILQVDSPTQLRLKRDYIGISGVGKVYTIVERTAYTISSIDSPTQLTLDRGYTGTSGAGKNYAIGSTLQSTEPGEREAPRMMRQHPQDLVLIGTLEPAIAQMLGLYWVDEKADPGSAFDYLILADHDGLFDGLEPREILDLLRQTGFNDLDGYIVFNKRAAPAPPLPAPEDLRAYALPGSVRPTAAGDLQDASNNAGLRWNLGTTEQGRLLPGKPVMYHLWRVDLGGEKPANIPPADQYQLVTKDRPILVTQPLLPSAQEPQRPPNWPPFPMHTIDTGLAEGWYSYQVSGIDIFGRHSPNSGPGEWYQWVPEPDPPPWYYQDPPGDRAINPFAVGLLDKIPPPPPAGIEAYALDPADPTVLQDAAYDAWQATLNPDERDTLIGLRVRWLWTEAHMRQAPDTREFRIYYYPGRMNSLVGRTLGVSAVSDTESDVETDVPNTQPAGTYVGGRLRIGSDAFAIIASEAGGPLQLRVKNIGPDDNIRPRANAPCTIAIPSNYTAGTISVANGSPTVTGIGTGWRAELTGRILQVVGESTEYTIMGVDSDVQVMLDRSYEGITGTRKAYIIKHPLYVDYSVPTNWQERYYVVSFDDDDHVTVTTDAAGRPLRQYEILLPAPDDTNRGGLPLIPSLAEPIVYAHIGVSAADDKPHTPDDPNWDVGDWGGRFGNEGRFGAPATIFRVLKEPLEPPAPPPPDSDKVFATSADYHGRSYYTYRWQPQQHLKTHIFRALDDALFKVDWSQRPRPALAGSQLQFFPSEADEPQWNAIKRQQVADELNPLNALSQDEEGMRQAMAFYRRLSNDALRVLAGLPGNERAFTQVATKPLDPDDPGNANRIGPDNPSDFPIDSELRIYIDKLDGRSANRYFYRAAYVDGAHNRSAMSLSSPPIYLPDVVPPRAPVITKVLGGDQQITLKWASNREPDLAEYRVYRANSEEAARDLRLMTLVQRIVPIEDPVARPAEVTWTDTPVPGLVTFYYTVVAVDGADNMSVPSPTIAGRAFEDSRPAPPNWNPPVPGSTPDAIVLTWVSPIADLACLVQRRPTGTEDWGNISGWLARGTYTFADILRIPGMAYDYRLRVLDTRGRQNGTFNVLTS